MDRCTNQSTNNKNGIRNRSYSARLMSSCSDIHIQMSDSGQHTEELKNVRNCSSLPSSQMARREVEDCSKTTQLPGEDYSVQSTVERSMDDTIVWSTGTIEQTMLRMGNSGHDTVLSRITTLTVLRDEGFIEEEEFQRRKKAIIDELTFPNPKRHTLKLTNGLPLVVAHAPNFYGIQPEEAIRHTFNLKSRQWETSQLWIYLDETPFAKGSLRLVYHLQEVSAPEETFVAKLAIDPDEDPQTYFRDIELQAHCANYATLYNEYNPPKQVHFIQAWVLELKQRNGALCAVERYIPGDYRKHNNNFGCVSDEERNTPQAFSHFTYEVSNHEVLAVDIQGVGDLYTDPQIHTLNGNDFGKGNLGVIGFQKFLVSHQCNSICRYLKLPSVNPKDRVLDCGTVPVTELMHKERIKSERFESKHYYEQAPMLRKYITQCKEDELEKTKRPKPFFNTVNCKFCGCLVM